jgi:geranylgeranyl transferase type-2 subunit beta
MWPSQKVDGCYAWWVYATACLIKREAWFDAVGLRQSLLALQDPVQGGFSSHSGRAPDLFHTHFALAALALLCQQPLPVINPCLCLPSALLRELPLKP